MPYDPDSLFHALSEAGSTQLPPVHLWDPDGVQDIDMRIARDGTWYYQGTPINRQRMVELFSRILRRDDDGYFLVTPVEKVAVQVDLAPFIATRMESRVEARGPAVALQTNVGDVVVVDQDHPLWVEQDERGPIPLVRIRGQLNALLSRSVFYELAESGTTRLINGRRILGIMSRGQFFELGPIDEE